MKRNQNEHSEKQNKNCGNKTCGNKNKNSQDCGKAHNHDAND